MKRITLAFIFCIAASLAIAGNPHKMRTKGFETALNLSKNEQMLLGRSGNYTHVLIGVKTDDEYEFHTYDYNSDNKVIAIFDSISQSMSYFDSISYNELGQLVRIDGWQWLDNSHWKKVNYIEYTYNAQGLLASRTNYNSATDWEVGGIYEYSYNSEGQIVLSELTMGGRIFGNVEYEYENGKLKSETYNFDLWGYGMEPSEKYEYSYDNTTGFVNEVYLKYYEDGFWYNDSKQNYFYDANGNCTEYRVTDNSNNIVERSLFEYDDRLIANAVMPYSPETERPKTFNNTNLYTIEHWYTVDDEHVLQYVCDYLYSYKDYAGIEDYNAADAYIYPNPASDFISIDAEGSVEITDMQGRIVKTTSTSKEELIDISDLPAGNYIIRITGDTKKAVGKFIIGR